MNYMHNALKAQTNKYNNVNQSNHLFCPTAQTLGSPAARGTIVPREMGVVRGEANVMLWYQFIGKPVTDGLREHFPWSVCVGGGKIQFNLL